jgi:hypothetical protein
MAPAPYRAFPVEDSEHNKIMQALNALAFKNGRPAKQQLSSHGSVRA